MSNKDKMASLFHEPENAMVYGTDQELNSGLSSEKVQGMANSIYSEFKRMMTMYGEDAIKELMPLIVTILEALDHSMTECNENVVEIEMLKDDNEQLATQFERERQLRRTAEQQLLEAEDHHETAARELRSKTEGIETSARHLELKCKNYSDQIERLQERESEIRKEYSVLHERHTEMIQSYAEHLERTKILQQQQSYSELSQSPRNKKDAFIGNSPSHSPIIKSFSTDSHKNAAHTPEVSQSALQSTPSDLADRPHLSLKEEFPGSSTATPVSDVSCEGNLTQLVHMGLESPSEDHGGQEWVSSEVKEMLENMDLEGGAPDESSHDMNVESTGIENVAFDKTPPVNETSLFAEMNEQDINDVDEGADILGMSKEVENLINENTKLLATKNALNVVKDDLIQQVDHLTTQQTLLKEELTVSEKTKVDLNEKLKELEKQVNKLQGELANVAGGNDDGTTARKVDDDETLPMSQRKRFTRVEMARVLMERNQYKERLMELQEAVRWTETLRASRAHADMNQPKPKNKSTIFQFFSRLFTSSGNDNNSSTSVPETAGRQQMRRSYGSGEVGISYNVPTSKVLPRSRSTQISLYGKSPTIDTLREEPQPKPNPETSKREIQAKIADSRLQACGWSLPNSPSTTKEGSRTVPVPVFCGPMVQDDSNVKLWCAAAVSACEGRTKDGGTVVGAASIFYDKHNEQSNAASTVNQGSESSPLHKLNQELEKENTKFQAIEKQQKNLGSLIWLVAGESKSGKSPGGNTIYVMDAGRPSNCLEKINVGTNDTDVLCITSVPGADVDDFNDADSKQQPILDNGAGEPGNVNSNPPGGTSPGEMATEATEALVAPNTPKKMQNKGVTEHVFTDPDSIHPTSTSPTAKTNDTSQIGTVEAVQSPILLTDDWTKGDVNTTSEDTRLASLQPTVWLGAQNGYVYVYSTLTNVRKCLHQIRLKDSVLAIVHSNGNVLAGLADGTVAFFRRRDDGTWNLSNYHLLDLGRPHHSIRCMAVVYDHVWCAYRNKIHVVKPRTKKIKISFDAHPRSESQVRQLAWEGDGVWLSIRLDSTVRLYHARTYQHLQDVDVEPYVSKVLGSGKLGFSFVRITALMISNHRLWIGTGNGVVMSVPLSEALQPSKNSEGMSTLERYRTCIRHQNVIAGCGVREMVCLLCGRPISIGRAASHDQCQCRDPRDTEQGQRRSKRTKMNKRAGTLIKEKFLRKRGSKSSSSAPVLSSTIRDRPGGVIRVYSDPVSEKITPGTFIPYCSMANAQLSFHGFRDAVKFFVAVPGCVTMSTTSTNAVNFSPPKAPSSGGSEGTLVLSGGGGYVDFRKGDLGALSPEEKKIEAMKLAQGTLQKSHVIVWQLTHS